MKKIISLFLFSILTLTSYSQEVIEITPTSQDYSSGNVLHAPLYYDRDNDDNIKAGRTNISPFNIIVRRGWVVFDASEIVDEAIVDSIKLHVNTEESGSSVHLLDVRSILLLPILLTTILLFLIEFINSICIDIAVNFGK